MLLWCTDTHLNFLRQGNGAEAFAGYLLSEHPDAQGLIITGDVSDGNNLEMHLRQLAKGWTKPLYFVLGNHDYYDSSFNQIDAAVTRIVSETSNLYWLNNGWHTLYDNMVLVGVGGWYDAYYGNYRSPVDLYDFQCIRDLKPLSRNNLVNASRERAAKEANRLAFMLNEACSTNAHTVVICTHIPPYPEASWHMGKQSDSDWVPWFSSASTGKVIDIYAEKYPEKVFIVLTGHSHSPGIVEKKNNLTIYTGPAKYHYPDIAGIIKHEERKLIVFDSFGNKVDRMY